MFGSGLWNGFLWNGPTSLAPPVVTPPTGEMVLHIRDMEAVLSNYPSAWVGYDLLRFIGPPKGLLADTYPGELAPNEQLAPLFCRALYLDAALFLCTQAKDHEQAARIRAEYNDVVRSLMGQVARQKEIHTRRFTEGLSVG